MTTATAEPLKTKTLTASDVIDKNGWYTMEAIESLLDIPRAVILQAFLSWDKCYVYKCDIRIHGEVAGGDVLWILTDKNLDHHVSDYAMQCHRLRHQEPQPQVPQAATLAVKAGDLVADMAADEREQEAYLKERDELTILTNVFREIATGDDRDLAKMAKQKLGKIHVAATPEDIQNLAFACKHLNVEPEKMADWVRWVVRSLGYLAAHNNRCALAEARVQTREAHREFERETKAKERELWQLSTKADHRSQAANDAKRQLGIMANRLPAAFFEGDDPPQPRKLVG